MKILICGGAGYIGSNMAAMLAEHGHQPIVYDNFSTGHRTAVGKAEFVEGDLADYELLTETLKTKNIEAVMHFAAFIEAAESVERPLKYYQNNLCNTLTLLKAMERCGVEKLVFSSTAAVYGIPKTMPIREDCRAEPINPYGQTKWAVERMCHYQSAAGKLRYAAFRYFNACGAGADCTLGEDHRPESHLIPLAIAAAVGGRKAMMIYGTDYPTADGTCVRDFIHIEDLCRAHLLVLNKLDTETELVYNLGNGRGYSVLEVIETVKKVAGRDFEVVQTQRRAGDAPVLVCDATKAKNQLGWEPKWRKLEEIVDSAWRWHSEHRQGYDD